MMLKQLEGNINYTNTEYQAMIKLKPYHKSQWADTSARIKQEVDIIKSKIKSELDGFQRNCVYCGALLWDSSNPEIEHIAPKYKYPEFMYHNNNLVYACHLCNASFRKGKKDTIDDYNDCYEQCTFKIVHPYFDNFRDHFRYDLQGGMRVLIIPTTNRGKNSVEMFELNDIRRVEARGKRIIAETIELTSAQEMKIKDVLEYRTDI